MPFLQEYFNRHIAEMKKIHDRMLARREGLQRRRKDFKEHVRHVRRLQTGYPVQFDQFERKVIQTWDEVFSTLKNDRDAPAGHSTSFGYSSVRAADGIPWLHDREEIRLFERKEV